MELITLRNEIYKAVPFYYKDSVILELTAS